MANQILGNVYIIDTGSANIAFPWPQGARIQAIKCWFGDSSGEAVFTFATTTNVFARLVHNAVNNADQNTGISFGNAIPMVELKVPTLTAGTAWIYFV